MATEAPVLEAPPTSDSPDITGLPTQEYDVHASGTVADILSVRKKSPAPAKDDAKEVEKAKKLDEAHATLRDSLFKNKKKKEERPAEQIAPVDPPADPPPADPPPADPPPAREVKPAPAKKVVTKDRATELAEKMADIERQRLDLERERLELEKKKAAPASQQATPPAEALTHLSPEERYEYEVFQAMAKLDPGTHGQTAQRFLDVAKATAKYKADWEKKNPGETFNPDDSDHDSFFADNQVKYDKKLFRRAEHKLATEGDEDPKFKELEKQNLEMRAKDKLRELEPAIREVFGENLDGLLGVMGEEVAKVAKEGGREKLLEEYPEEGEELLRAAGAIEALSVEAHRILEMGGLVAPDNNNPVQQAIITVIRQQEALIPRQPRDQRLDPEGRDFATWEQWLNMSQQQQAAYWHLGAREVVDIMSTQVRGTLKAQLDKMNRLVERRMKRAAPPAEPRVETRSPAASPAAASKSTVDTTSKTTATPNDKINKIIRSSLFKRSS